MQIPILVEPISPGGYRASTGARLDLQIEAPTRDEAIGQLRQLIQRRIAQGAERVELELAATQHLLARFVGMFKDNPLLQEWEEAMAEYRSQAENGTDAP